MGPRKGREPYDVMLLRKILKSSGVKEYEPGCLTYLLNFMHQYACNISKIAKRVSSLYDTSNSGLSYHDVILAIQSLSASLPQRSSNLDFMSRSLEKNNRKPYCGEAKVHSRKE